MWCWHRIKETESGLCPACRTPYGDDPHEFSAVDMEEVLKANKEKALAEKRERERLRAMRDQEAREKLAAGSVAPIAPGSGNFASALASAGGLGGAGGGGSSFGMFDGADLVAALGSGGGTGSKGPPEPPKDRSTLATMRVIRRNLVYAVGLPPSIATEEILRRPEYFGQYGKISKIVINRNHNPGDTRRASASAYVTFAHKEDTLACVLALDGFYHDGRNVRASYGTSKYCSAFIKTVRCNNPDCTYLHHMGDTEDTFTKQEIQAGYVTSGRDVMARQQQIMAQQAALLGGTGKKKVGGGGPSGTGKNATNPVFPPPTYDEPLPKKPVSQRGQPAIIMNRAQSVGPSAASIVAGGGKSSTAPPAAHTLLTPLKRGTSMPPAKPVGVTSPSADLTPAELLALEKEKKEALAQQQRELAQKAKAAATVAPSSPSHSSIGSGASRGEISTISSKTTNTVIIGGSSSSGEIGPGGLGGSNLMGSPLLGGGFTSGSLGGMGSIAPPPSAMDFGSATGSGVLGGQPLNAGLIGGTSLGAPPGNSFQLDSLLGSTSNHSGGDKWGAIGGGPSQNNTIGGSAALSSGGLWEGEDKRFNPAPIGPRNGGLSNGPSADVGGVSLFGTNQNGFSNGGSGSSALASMLGIELPTGSGSLREASGTSLFGPPGQAPIGGLDTAPNSNRPSVIGSNPRGGMQPIGAPGGGRAVNNGFSGGVGAIGGGNNNDVALLQSLLPGVNITSGNTYRQSAQQQPVGVGGLNQTSDLWIGGNNNNNNAGASQEQQQRGNGIW
eukprot:scaffold646_cov131-Skeletonema_dohrnii-CCMP3373.AAC.6